ncbi:trithorax group protein osa isoform X2 [Diachasma alloeum]|uniref:trithorax group protein osa isoform X2 n=1 Tax=Diachasma alloeum TaxID=454923 RepID=UPI0007381AB0|nr:trithorax group protein osa isoform X2 [Diachasma alloeum]
MAATQAESQQNDVKHNETVKCNKKRGQNSGNSASVSINKQLEQEPTDKINRGAAQLLKYVNRGDGDTGYEMSQYREDIGGHNVGDVKSPRDGPQNSQNISGIGGGDGSTSKQESQGQLQQHEQTHSQHGGQHSGGHAIHGHSGHHSGHSPHNIHQSHGVGHGANYSGGNPTGGQHLSRDYHQDDYQGKSSDFGGKQTPGEYHKPGLSEGQSEGRHHSEMEEHYSSKIEGRLGHIVPGGFPGQPRFLSGQSISQATGPTPTLNQLLQATSSPHRFHPNYPGIAPESYQQPWPMQRPPVVPPVYPQPSQRPPQTGSPRLHPGPGGPSSPTPMPYQPYTTRYPSPARPHSPYGHHQLNSYATQGGHPPSLYPDQRAWNQAGPPNAPPPPPSQANSSSQSPQRALSQSPAPPPSASPQPQPTPGQQQNYHNMQRSTTPNTQGIDSGELSGQNSNDSSNGPAGPGTPNSQGMRPTPSPTGSTGSRSMSPAVGQQNVQMPPRPSSSQSDGSGPARMSHSPMATQGGYQQPLGPSGHMHGYKMNSSGVPTPPTGIGGPMGPMGGAGMGYPASGNAPQSGGYPGQTPGGYPPPRPHMSFPGQGYPPPTNSQHPPAAPNNQYQPARPNNLVQYPPYPHKMGFNSVPPGMPPSPGPPPPPPSQGGVNYGGSGGVPTNTPMTTGGIGNMGPPASSMGPPPPSPNHVGNSQQQQQQQQHSPAPPPPPPPPPGPSATGPPGQQHQHQHQNAQHSHPHPQHPHHPPHQGSQHQYPQHSHPQHPHPPAATPPLNHEGSPMPPPSTTPNSHPAPAPTPTSHGGGDIGGDTSNDSGITTTASGTAAINVTSTSSGTVTSVITTGPDGTSIDEGSQQSTLSNASAASGEDPAFTPKIRKDMIGGYHSHPATPQSTVPSPGAASINSIHEEYPDINSPSWPRTPASPVFNSHVPQDPYRSKKPDSLAKLYEMDDSPERRNWLDKLVSFMEERRTPITSCPTISKNPLDLFRLYLYVKERGGFMEVCKVTKNKTWKDIAGLLGIGASSSAAYTLRKHYTKHLLTYECHFDRGGVDPQPIINQVEAGSKKKGSKGTASVPSPGSSNSQDSFPAAGSSSASMDGYGNYQSNYQGGNQGGPPSDYTPPPPRPPSQSSAPSPHQGMQQGNYQNAGSYQNYPQEQYIRPQGGPMNQQGEFNQPYSPRSHYPPYVSEPDRVYPGGNIPGNSGPGQDMYNRYSGPQQPGYPPGQTPPGRSANYPQPAQNQPPSTSQPSSPSPSPANPTYSCPQDYYRQEAGYGTPPGGQMYPSNVPAGGANKNMPPPPPGPTQPRRHPDFTKDQQYPQYNQQRPPYPGWPSGGNQYNQVTGSANNRVPYPNQQPPPPPTQQQPHPPHQHQQHPSHPPHQPHQPHPPQQPPSQAQSVSANSPSGSGVAMSSSNQPWPNLSNQPPARPSSQPSINPLPHAPPPPWDNRYSHQPSTLYPPPGSHQVRASLLSQLSMNPMITQQTAPKREMTFPPDSVEAVTPLLYKRRKLARSDVAPVEAWRIMMALRSGLLAESCWALDVLNILLFDDSSVSYFGLTHLPGLLDVLLEHFSRSLSDMFESSTLEEDHWDKTSDIPEVDLGAVSRPIDSEDRTKLLTTSNYTFLSRRGRPVKMVPRDDDIFVLDNRRPWDHLDTDAECEPWQVDPSDTKYIITCFQSEIGMAPFARHLRDEKPPLLQKEVETLEIKDESRSQDCEKIPEITNESLPKCPELLEKSSKENGDLKLKQPPQHLHLEKKKKPRTLSDVLSRIKKEPVEMNDLTRELFEKKNDGSKRDCEADGKQNNNMGEHPVDFPKTEDNNFPTHNGLSDSTSTFDPQVKSEDPDNSDDNDHKTNDPDTRRTKKKKPRPDDDHDDREQTDDEDDDVNRDKSQKDNQLDDTDTHKEGPRLQIKDPAGTLKRRRISDYEDESYSRDEASLYLVTESQDSLARRCVCLSTILRNLTFIPGNELEFAKNVTFLSILGKLLLLHHEHPVRTQKTRNYDREEDADFADSCSSLQGENEWWWDFLYHIRENVLVMAANIAGYTDLSQHPEEISRPVLDGLLHWAVCPAAHGQDPFPTVNMNSSLSPQRLALEALCKLCVTESNVDLVVATPPYSRLQRLCSVLTRLLCRSEEQVLREFGVNLLHFLSAADSGVARTIALQTPCVALLVAFIEQAESSALGVANQHGFAALRENPESMGTSLDMLRRAAGTLLNLARHPDNRTLLLQHESRLLALVMSQILDQQVAAIVARVLFQCSRGAGT